MLALATDSGDDPPPRSADSLVETLYGELHALARARLAHGPPGRSVQATVLVHEAYLRLAQDAGAQWNGRGHFFAAAAVAMRRILVEQARARRRLKRGGDAERVALSAIEPAESWTPERLLAVDEALSRLEELDPRKARIVSLRYFTGLTNAETAAALDLSVGTIEREWRFIKPWLHTELGD